ncbi:hypothetical protein AMTRI_Chr04g247400 [Amborella trichopoda]
MEMGMGMEEGEVEGKSMYEVMEETRKSMEEAVAKMLFSKKERSKADLSPLLTQVSLLFLNLRQRKQLCRQREELEQRKRTLQETIANRKKFLSSLPSHLKSLKKASLPVQQQLGILHTKKMKQHQSAELLPPPLYVIYSQLFAHKEAFGENIDVEITGSVKDAQAFAQQLANKDVGLHANVEDSKLEGDAPEEEDDGQRRRKWPKKARAKEDMDLTGVYHSHPLNVILHVYDDEFIDAKPVKLVSVRFEYLLKLNVVCVGVEGSQEGPGKNLLCNLFPDDTGNELPHQTAKIFVGDDVAFDEKKTMSCPYKWAQHLAGFDFLPEVSPFLTNSYTSICDAPRTAAIQSGLSMYRHQHRVRTVVQRIRARMKAQLVLSEQLDLLAQHKWPPLTYEDVPWALHSPLCALSSWLPVDLTPEGDSSVSTVGGEQLLESLETENDGKSGTLKEELESTREDGELPLLIIQGSTLSNEIKLPIHKVSNLEHSQDLNFISKSNMPSKGKPQTPRKLGALEEYSEVILEDETDEDMPAYDSETEDASGVGCHKKDKKSWKDSATREFILVLSYQMNSDEKKVNLEARVKISMEYPLRPPYFTLRLFTGDFRGRPPDVTQDVFIACDKSEWYNELRAMEAEVNLHILKLLPRDHDDCILAHQVKCLAMLFDFQMGQASSLPEARKATSLIDVGLCKPVGGKIIARSFRGRDRRRMISWKNRECVIGYPY